MIVHLLVLSSSCCVSQHEPQILHHGVPCTWQLPWLAREEPWLAVAGPFLTLLAGFALAKKAG